MSDHLNQYQIGETEAEMRSARAKAMAKALREHQGQPRFGGTKMALSSGPSFSKRASDSAELQPSAHGGPVDNAHD